MDNMGTCPNRSSRQLSESMQVFLMRTVIFKQKSFSTGPTTTTYW